jgi:hypothetical protein
MIGAEDEAGAVDQLEMLLRHGTTLAAWRRRGESAAAALAQLFT